ncbi:MAG: bifunctional diaminohydroxyphosphoribosylaminopyrimidine deaminase/5-amino-6-(5-phosphoribosylamino)uracil reductase RibD [Acidobacteriota bacterium]
MPADTDHLHFMKRALQLARRGVGRVSPNPLVGAVIVRDGRIVGEGYHLYERKDHAEIVALRQAGALARGADLYLNLEPCSHVGRTPPCAGALVGAGIRRVFVAVRDSNPLVSGRGITTLMQNGIEVQEGLCRDESARLNEKFFHFIQTGRPFALLKLALTLDGRIATAAGESRWITDEPARHVVHQLRYEYDAVLVGIGTVLRDDPSLDTRGTRRKALTKIIFDSNLRTPPQARVFSSPGTVVIFHDPGVPPDRVAALREKALLLPVRRSATGLDWNCAAKTLGEQKITSVMIEGGGQIAASALASGVVQKIAFFYAPKVLGSKGIPAIGALDIPELACAIQLRDPRIRRLGQDWMLEGYPTAPPGPSEVRLPE